MFQDFAALLGTTRGQVLTLLRAGPRTVNDIAAALDLTDNAVRAHLATLTADGLIDPAGTTPGARKPHTLYELTGRAREHFSRLYVPVLNALLASIDQFLDPDRCREILREAGHRLAAAHETALRGRPLDQRIAYALNLLAELGAVAPVRQQTPSAAPGACVIQGEACPLSEAVANRPEVCILVETLLADLVGRPVHEHCQHGPHPRCCFHIE